MSSGPHFRRAQAADADRAVDLMIRSAPALSEIVFGPALPAILRRGFIEQKGVWASNRGYVLEDAGEVIAFMTAYPVSEALPRVFGCWRLVFSERPLREAFGIVRRFIAYGRLYKPLPLGGIYLANLACDPTRLGQGLGTRLIEAVIAAEQRGGPRVLALDVAQDNPRAEALYERFGFVKTASTPDCLGIPGLNRMLQIPPRPAKRTRSLLSLGR